MFRSFLEHKKGNPLTFYTPGGEITGYGNFDISIDDTLPGLQVEATAKTAAQTGVEMEALVAVSVSLVTVYDMAKAVDRSMVIGEISLAEKVGGRSGHWQRS